MEYEQKKDYKRLIEHGLTLDLDSAAKEFLIDKGYSTEFGARPLRRAIEHYIEDPLSEGLLKGEFKGKGLIKISVQDEEHLKFEGKAAKKTKKSKEPKEKDAVVHSEGKD